MVKFSKIILLCFSLSACSLSLQRWQYSSAISLIEKRKFTKATQKLAKVVKRDPGEFWALKAARRGSQLAYLETKEYSLAADFYRHLILYSPDAKERLDAQRSLAEILFDKLANYDQAVVELSRLLLLLPSGDRAPYQYALAKAHFNLNNSAQASVEIAEILNSKIDKNLRFDVMVFKAHLLQATKSLDEAIKVYEEIIKLFPTRAKVANISMGLAVCYEEKAEFKKAIEILETIKADYPNPEFLEIRIGRLKNRLANLPGAQGFKR